MQGRKPSEDDDLSEVEEEPTSSSEEEVRSEIGASRSDEEEVLVTIRQAKIASKGTLSSSHALPSTDGKH